MVTRPGFAGHVDGVRWLLGLVLAAGAGLGCGSDLEGEVCDVTEELSECGPRGKYNVCDTFDGELQWGECHKIECKPGDSKSCDGGEAYCGVEDGVPAWSDCIIGYGTPLVLSFDRAEPQLSEVAAAAFDPGSGGACIQTDWPAAETPWLAMDRDRSGSIDGGHELFGSGTVLVGGGRGAHGFTALAELDANRDGRISPDDPQFAQLVLWADHDRDKRSTLAEHDSLAARGVVAIELGWRDEAVCDARGNCGVERAAFVFIGADGRTRTGEVIDVHLPCQ